MPRDSECIFISLCVLFFVVLIAGMIPNCKPTEKPHYKRPMFRANCYPLKPHYTCSEIVEAIGKAENSKEHPYGVMIKTNDPWQVCMNTVKHNVMGYVNEGEPGGDFIHYLSLKYTEDHVNWERNVKYFLKKG